MFGNKSLTGQFRVSAAGDVDLPPIGEGRAAGLTPEALESRVANRVTQADLVNKPSVTAKVIAYRPIFVLGEVNKPGQYPYQPGMTALTAVAVVGGFTYRATSMISRSCGRCEARR